MTKAPPTTTASNRGFAATAVTCSPAASATAWNTSIRYYGGHFACGTGGEDILRRISAAQIEGAVIGQVRALLRQPEIVAGGWLVARQEAPDLSEEDARDALSRLDPLWEELFPAEQQRIIHALVDRVVVGPTGADIRLRVEGLGSLARDLGRGGRAA